MAVSSAIGMATAIASCTSSIATRGASAQRRERQVSAASAAIDATEAIVAMSTKVYSSTRPEARCALIATMTPSAEANAATYTAVTSAPRPARVTRCRPTSASIATPSANVPMSASCTETGSGQRGSKSRASVPEPSAAIAVTAPSARACAAVADMDMGDLQSVRRHGTLPPVTTLVRSRPRTAGAPDTNRASATSRRPRTPRPAQSGRNCCHDVTVYPSGSRVRSAVAFAVTGLGVVGAAVAIGLDTATGALWGDVALAPGWTGGRAGLATAASGAFVVRRRGADPVGVALVALGLSNIADGIASATVNVVLARGGSLDGFDIAIFLAQRWALVPVLLVPIALALL